MQIKVELNYLRIAPRKVGQVTNLVRGKKAEQAETFLNFLTNRPAKSVLKLLRSGIAAAKHDFQLEPSNLYISRIFVGEGPKLKRWRPVSRGSAHSIWKRTSHITLILEEIKPTAKKKIKKSKQPPKEPLAIEKTEAEKTEEVAKEMAVPKREEKPRFEKREEKKQKTPGTFRRIFRRKSI